MAITVSYQRVPFYDATLTATRWKNDGNIASTEAETFPETMVDTMGAFTLFWCHTWWLIPLSKWVITPVINGISRVNPLIIGVITHLLSGMNHQVEWGV